MGDSFDDMESYSGLIPDSDEEFETDLDELDYDELLVLAEDLKSKLEKAKTALNEIASWESGPVVNSGFDCPGNAITARKALDGLE